MDAHGGQGRGGEGRGEGRPNGRGDGRGEGRHDRGGEGRGGGRRRDGRPECGDCGRHAPSPATSLGSLAVTRGAGSRVVEAGWVRLQHTGRVVLAASEEVRFSALDVILVQTERGDVHARALQDSARSTLTPDRYSRVLRRVPPAEAAAVLSRDKAREEEARAVFIEQVRRHRLDMHLSDVEVTHGDSRVIFYFTAPGRIDFRSLVRDLASGIRARIELRQVGVRDEARCTGGLGPCGLPLCCSTFLRDFAAVTIRMAKVQGLVPNPQKVSGLCGRLMCCLAYEQDVYVEMMKEFPKTGSMVSTPKGDGKVKELLVMRRAVKVSLGPGQMIEVPLDEVKPLARPGGQGGPAGQGNEQAAVEAEGDGADVESDEDPAELKGLED